MAFEATKKEWCELYTFFRLLADGKVVLGTAEAKIGETSWPIAMIQREEHDGTRRYYIEEESVRIEGETGVKSMPREDFGIVADLILQAVKSSSENDVTSPEGVEEFLDVADRVFRSNLLMIDLHFPRVLTEMIRIMHLDGISRISELTEVIKQMNPLKIKDELINKHCFYEFKIKQFLMALALGMRPAKIYNGQDSAVEGILLVGGNGEVLCYHKSEKQVMEDFLFRNTRLEKGSLDKDKYGFLEKENGVYYFKLNAKIGLVKR